MQKLRVLTILHQLSLTGAPKIALDACEALNEDVEPFFVSLEEGPLQERCQQIGPLCIIAPAHQTWARVTEFDAGSVMRTISRRIRKTQADTYLTRLKKQIQAWNPDVIYVNSVVSLNILEILDFPGVPILLHVHELDMGIEIGLSGNITLLTTRPDKYIAVATPVQNLLIDRFGIDKDLVTLVHEFVPDADLQMSFARADKLADGRFVVGGAGQPGWRKGTTLWLQMAVELTHLMGPDKVRFIWVGVGSDINSAFFKEEARKFGIADAIEFISVTKTPLEHYAKFDAFGMTSFEDPCPLVVLENMMLKTPVFCFAGSGGAPEEVGEAGVIVENFSPLAMAASIAELADDAGKRLALGEAARQRVKECFTASRQAPKILAELRYLAQKTGNLK